MYVLVHLMQKHTVNDTVDTLLANVHNTEAKSSKMSDEFEEIAFEKKKAVDSLKVKKEGLKVARDKCLECWVPVPSRHNAGSRRYAGVWTGAPENLMEKCGSADSQINATMSTGVSKKEAQPPPPCTHTHTRARARAICEKAQHKAFLAESSSVGHQTRPHTHTHTHTDTHTHKKPPSTLVAHVSPSQHIFTLHGGASHLFCTKFVATISARVIYYTMEAITDQPITLLLTWTTGFFWTTDVPQATSFIEAVQLFHGVWEKKKTVQMGIVLCGNNEGRMSKEDCLS